MTAVDPRTILANALGYLRDEANGWQRRSYGWWHFATRTDIFVDRYHIAVADGDGHRDVALFSEGETPSATAARAVDKLCADGVLPHRLSTGYQLASQQWAKRVAEAEEAKRLADQQIQQHAADLELLHHHSNKLIGEYAQQIAELEQQIADLRGHTSGGDTVVDLPAIGAAA